MLEMMKQVNGAAFRKRQAQHMNECEEENRPILVTTYKKESQTYQRMVVMTDEQYIMMIDQINKDNKQ